LHELWLGFALAAGLQRERPAWRWRSSGLCRLGAVEDWMAHYHFKPEPQRRSQAIHTLAGWGAFDGEARRQPATAFVGD
jgi:hypothetical protein